jgi:solute carrier family 35, member F5
MSITLSSDFIYVLAMLKTTPLVVTVGLSLTIPLAVLGDFLLGQPAAAIVVLGAVLVLFSFVAVGWEDSKLVEAEAALSRTNDALSSGDALYDEEDVAVGSEGERR